MTQLAECAALSSCCAGRELPKNKFALLFCFVCAALVKSEAKTAAEAKWRRSGSSSAPQRAANLIFCPARARPPRPLAELNVAR